MAARSLEDKREQPDRRAQDEEDQDQEEEEEESLSLCDLPVKMVKGENNQAARDQEAHQETETNQEEFDFGPIRGGDGSLSNRSYMCAADDIFFQGQILPLRLSVSSENVVNRFKNGISLNPCQCLSRSESMDHNSLGGLTSFSSRSSSSRSHFSTSSSSSTSTAIARTRMIKPIIQNQFLAHPSPKPQIRLSIASLGNAASSKPRNSSIWDLFRLGLVRTPEIELQDLKARNSVSRNSSSSSSNSSINKCSRIYVSNGNSKSSWKIKNASRHSSTDSGRKMEKQSLLEKSGGLLSGCSCSVSAEKPVPLKSNIAVVKSSSSRSRSAGNGNNDKSGRGSMEVEEKLQELKMKKRMVHKQQDGKQALSRHRTFEWIKQLSHANTYLDHEEEAV
ncbi:hypothetical protein OIU74_005043 [Salix koriyanagi]|uniref:Uncharacterized protein n=1 Tax=Salix koriyanagi TaxID=2511006 RepID=A0A9Q0UN19_9ROSI|nr:hypothetical protein OIU74_005043 [Salix koriyanagi]